MQEKPLDDFLLNLEPEIEKEEVKIQDKPLDDLLNLELDIEKEDVKSS